MTKELEALKIIKIKCHPNSNPSPLVDGALETLEQALQRLEAIDNSKKDINSLYSNMHQTSDELDKSLKDSLLKNAKIEAIDNTNPSEALKSFDYIVQSLEAVDDIVYMDCIEHLTTIKQALLKSQENEKVLEIIKEKGIDIGWLRQCDTVESYNYHCEAKQLTEEEFDTLKEALLDEKNN